MFSSLVNVIHDTILPFGAVGVFTASILEEVIAPIPSAVVQLSSGFFFLEGTIDSVWIFNFFFVILIPVSLGVALGSLVVYGIAYVAGKPALLKWGKWFGVSWKEIEVAQAKLKQTKADEVSLFVARAIPILPSVVVSAVYGLMRYNILKYVVISFFGTLIRAGVLAIIGWQVGSFYVEYIDLIDRFETMVLLFLVVVFCLFILYRQIRARR